MYDAYIFDQDGTIYLGEQPLPGAAETIAALRAAGKRTIFLSNNPTKTREQYAAKLTRLGIPTPIEAAQFMQPLAEAMAEKMVPTKSRACRKVLPEVLAES